MLSVMRKDHQAHPLLVLKNNIELAEDNITQRLEKWRELQAIHMPSVKASVLAQESSPSVESERLCLPSHFSDAEKAELSLSELALEEAELREAQLYECILQLRRVTKILSTMHGLKRKGTQTQKDSTRSHTSRKKVEQDQHCLLRIYQSARKALLAVSSSPHDAQSRFPPLIESDLLRKSTVDKRALGDSHRGEGHLWSAVPPIHGPGPSSGKLLDRPTAKRPGKSSESIPPNVSLGRDTPNDSFHPLSHEAGDAPRQGTDSGRLWNTSLGLSNKELELWELEGTSLCLTVLEYSVDAFLRGSCAMASDSCADGALVRRI